LTSAFQTASMMSLPPPERKIASQRRPLFILELEIKLGVAAGLVHSTQRVARLGDVENQRSFRELHVTKHTAKLQRPKAEPRIALSQEYPAKVV